MTDKEADAFTAGAEVMRSRVVAYLIARNMLIHAQTVQAMRTPEPSMPERVDIGALQAGAGVWPFPAAPPRKEP